MVHGSWTLKQFCDFFYITRLLMVHGRNSYNRSASLSQFVIHRGLIITTMQVSILLEASYLFIFSLCLNANDTQNQERFICGIIYNRPLPPSFLSNKRNVVPDLLDVAMNKEIFCNTPRGLFCILGCLLCSVLLREHIIIPGINHCQKRTTCFILKYRPKVQTHFGDSLLKNKFSDI